MTEPNQAILFDAPEPARLAPLFPGYSIECLIATGGMGAVYKAVQISLERPVAIKILPQEFGQDQEFRGNFETEAKTMARLNHPNLIGVYDFGEVEGMLFIVMEFVPGKTLFHSTHGIAIAGDEAARIVIGVCMALAHAHEHGILHRDIKPGNILLDQRARPKIGDFGLARSIGAAHKDGEAIFGTPDYTAPEVLKSPNSVDARADIFSVGVIFYELLTGRLPGTDSPPPSVLAGCDLRFDAIIRRATEPIPQMRFASAAELAKEITAVAATGTAPPAQARPASTPATRNRPLPVRRAPQVTKSGSGVAAGVLGYLVVAAVLAIALFIFLRKSPDTPTATTRTPTTNSGVQPLPPSDPTAPPEIQPANKIVPEPDPQVGRADPAPVAKALPPPLPAFDAPGYLDKARAFTRQKASPYLAAHAKELEKNYSAFERRVKREERDLDKTARGYVESAIKDKLEEWRKDGNHVPKTLDLPGGDKGRGRGGPGRERIEAFRKALDEIRAEFLAKQEKIDSDLEAKMLDLSTTIYQLGLQKKITQLTDPNAAPSVEVIQAEIDLAHGSLPYFIALMRGVDPKEARAAP